MLTRFIGGEIFVVFKSSSVCGGPACRVLGPYTSVRLAAKGIWAMSPELIEPVRLATQHNLSWGLDGFPDDPPWGEMTTIAPTFKTTAREIEAENDWIRPIRE